MLETPKCSDWDEWLQDRIDGDLEPTQSTALDEHIASCSACRARLDALRAVDAALSGHLSGEVPGASFDQIVLKHIVAAADADRDAARARVEQEWRDQMAVLSRQWHKAWRSMILNALAGSALLVAMVTTLRALPFLSRLTARVWPLMQHVAVLPLMTLPVAAGLTFVALWLARSLAVSER